MPEVLSWLRTVEAMQTMTPLRGELPLSPAGIGMTNIWFRSPATWGWVCVLLQYRPYSPLCLLCDGCQAQLSLVTNITVFAWCTAHANGNPWGCHLHEPSNGQWHMQGNHACMPHQNSLGWLWVGTHRALLHFL